MCPQSGSEKKNYFYVDYVKISIKISLFVTCFYIFCTAHKNVRFFTKLYHEHIECRYLHASNFS
jgi:hypothetical protein